MYHLLLGRAIFGQYHQPQLILVDTGLKNLLYSSVRKTDLNGGAVNDYVFFNYVVPTLIVLGTSFPWIAAFYISWHADKRRKNRQVTKND